MQNLHEKCSQLSPNMPGIGVVICEIDFDFSLEKNENVLHGAVKHTFSKFSDFI